MARSSNSSGVSRGRLTIKLVIKSSNAQSAIVTTSKIMKVSIIAPKNLKDVNVSTMFARCVLIKNVSLHLFQVMERYLSMQFTLANLLYILLRLPPVGTVIQGGRTKNVKVDQLGFIKHKICMDFVVGVAILIAV